MNTERFPPQIKKKIRESATLSNGSYIFTFYLEREYLKIDGNF